MAAVVSEDGLGLFAPGRRALALGSTALISMIAFEAMAVAAAMPAIATALDGLPLFALAFGGTLALSMLGLVVGGDDCDRHGPHRSMSLGMLLFALGLLIAGLAPTMWVLVLGRLVQGLGSGMLGVALYVAMARLLPASLHPRMFALFAAAWVLPGIAGPAVAGLLVDHLGWRWVFLAVLLLLLPSAAMVYPATQRLVQNAPSGEHRGHARIGWAVLGAGAALALHSLSQPGLDLPTRLLAVALAGLAAWAAARQLLPLGTLRAARGLPAVIALRGLLAAAFFSAEAFIPLWLTQEHGWSTASAGIALSIGAVCWSLGSAIQARIEAPAARQRVLQLGLLLVALGIAAILPPILHWLPAASLIAGWLLAGLGIGLSFPMLSVLTLKLSPLQEQGSNSSALQMSDALATSCALAGCGAVFTALHLDTPTLAYAAVFAFALALALLATACAARVQR